MDTKGTIKSLIESLINDTKREVFESMYGINSKFQVRDIGYSDRNKILYIDAKIILGDTIDESVIDPEMINFLILDNIKYIYNDVNLNLTISFDV